MPPDFGPDTIAQTQTAARRGRAESRRNRVNDVRPTKRKKSAAPLRRRAAQIDSRLESESALVAGEPRQPRIDGSQVRHLASTVDADDAEGVNAVVGLTDRQVFALPEGVAVELSEHLAVGLSRHVRECPIATVNVHQLA